MMRLYVLLLAVACGGGAPPPESSATATAPEAVESVVVVRTIDERITSAAALLTTGDPAAAQESLADLGRLIMEAPDRVEVPYNMGLAYHQMGNIHNAKRYYLKATQLDPELTRAWLNLGVLAEEQGDYRRALQHYRAGLRAKPDAGRLVVGVVRSLRALGRNTDAIREAKTSLKKDAENIEVYNVLGLVYLDMGQPDLAAFIYDQARLNITGADNNATLHSNLGRVHLARGAGFDARKEFEKALALDPQQVPALMFMAHQMMDNHDWSAVAGVLERARALEPDNASIRINLGIAYRGLKKYELSRQEYEKAIELNGENLDPYLNLALLLGNHVGDIDAGISSIQAYRTRGGANRARADQILKDLEKRKADSERAAKYQRDRDADAKKAKEQERKAKEYEAMQETWRQQEEAKRLEAEAAQERALRAQELAAPVPVAPSSQDEAAEPAPQQTESSAPVWAAPSPAPPAPEPASRGSRQVGAPCDTTSQCVSGASCINLSCAGAPASRPQPAPVAAPTPAPVSAAPVGTRQAGAPCAEADECASGLNCTNGTCTDPNPPAGGGWGGWE
jgi:tetratricopeptide (TPR) repeat protein